MAEESTKEIPTINEDDTQMAIDTSEVMPIEADDVPSDKGASTLGISGSTSAAASTPVSECASAEDAHLKGPLTLPVSETTSAAASISASDSECTGSPDHAPFKEGALALPVSGEMTEPISSDSGCAMASDHMHERTADQSTPLETTTPPVSGRIADNSDMLSPEKEKFGLFKGVKTAIKTKVQNVWKKLSPKKTEKTGLCASVQEKSIVTPAPETDKKPIKVVTYVSATRGSLVLNSIASDEITQDTDLPTSSSEVFLPDEESIATCDTATHASRLPSLGDSSSEPSEESESKVEETPGDHGDETMDEDVVESS